jgi:activator of HSP90 ATPase
MTRYFNRELTEEEKALIGDIAPKKVEPSVADAARAEVGSAWNYAGTWEEKNMTEWSRRRLEELFKDFEVNLPSGDASVRIKSVNSIAGDAQITMARGKRKHIYDFTIDLQWELEVDEQKALGSIKLIDVNADGEYEIDVEVDRQSAPSTRSLIDAYVKRSGDGLQPALVAKLMQFRDEFRQK